MNPSISIIIPAWQAAGTLPKTLSSLVGQTLQPTEIFVVDDASTDDLVGAVAPWKDRVRIIRLEKNSGAPMARNTGLALATGEFVMFADADIVFKSDALEKLHATLLTHPEAAYAYPSFHFGWKKFVCGPFEAEKLRRGNFIHTSALIRRSAAPHFDPTLKRFQDWDLWLTLLEQGKTGVWCPESLYHVLTRAKGVRISAWRPAFWYRIPWRSFGFVPKSVQAYEGALEIVRVKHHL